MEMVEEGLHSIALIVEKLGDPNLGPTIVHCAVGRDRTGIVIAILLDLLDVPDDMIAYDYWLSDSIVQDGARAHAETIHRLLHLLRQRHTSSRKLLEAAGVPSLSFEKLREVLLEGSAGEALV